MRVSLTDYMKNAGDKLLNQELLMLYEMAEDIHGLKPSQITPKMEENLIEVSNDLRKDFEGLKYLRYLSHYADKIFKGEYVSHNELIEELPELIESKKRNYWKVVEAERSEYPRLETPEGTDSMTQENQNLRNILTKTNKLSDPEKIQIGFSE